MLPLPHMAFALQTGQNHGYAYLPRYRTHLLPRFCKTLMPSLRTSHQVLPAFTRKLLCCRVKKHLCVMVSLSNHGGQRPAHAPFDRLSVTPYLFSMTPCVPPRLNPKSKFRISKSLNSPKYREPAINTDHRSGYKGRCIA